MRVGRREFIRGASGLLIPAMGARGQSLILRGPAGSGGGGVPSPAAGAVAGAYNVDPNNLTGNAGGNGILVGETGRSGGSASGVSGTGPWSLAQFFAQLEGSTLIPGDVIHLYTGNYAPTTPVNVAVGGGSSNGHAGAKIQILPRPGHTPTIDYRASAGLGVTDRAVVNASGGAGCFVLDDASNIQWGSENYPVLTAYGTGTTIWGATVTAPGGAGSQYRNIRYGDDHSEVAIGGGNGGVIKIESGSRDILIRGVRTIAGMEPRYNNGNWAFIYWLGTQNLIIEYCLVVCDNGSGYVIQNKRLGDATIRNSLFADLAGGAIFKAERFNDHTFDNCIGAGSGLIVINDDTTSVVRDSNISVTNCTLTPLNGAAGPDSTLALGVQFGTGNVPAGSGKNNTVRRNIINGGIRLGYVGTTIGASYTHDTDFDYNQHPASGVNYREFATYTSLAALIAGQSGWSSPPAQNSISVTPNFGTLDPYDPSSFQPTNPQTIGGSPVGAVVANVGPEAIGLTI